MNIINSFLEKLHTDESMFPMDNATDESEDDKKEKSIIMSEQKKDSDKKRIMIDLDGTIHKYSKGWNGGAIYDPPFEGAVDAIKWLKKQGFEIMIFTCRASKANNKKIGRDYLDHLKKIKEWLDEYGIPYDGVTADKLEAEFYIDDRAVHIPNGNWDFVVQTIQKRMSM